jgi:hypothetical protein
MDRNAAGHNLIDTYSQEDALRFVVFVDLLLAMVGRISDQQDTGEVWAGSLLAQTLVTGLGGHDLGLEDLAKSMVL